MIPQASGAAAFTLTMSNTHQFRIPETNPQAQAEFEDDKKFWQLQDDGNSSSDSHFLYMLPLQKPQSDNKQYRLIKLMNELEVLLVHDPTTDKAAACMNLNVGACQDPVCCFTIAIVSILVVFPRIY